MTERVYTPQELADVWRCSAYTVRGLLTTGSLRGFKVGKSWRITEEARRDYEQTSVTRERKPRATVLKIS